MRFFENCRLCPRRCGINRRSGTETSGSGYCGETDQLRVAYVGPHFGEEPPITGVNGSGTVFFAGCSLRCSFCQNYQISHQGTGKVISLHSLIIQVERIIRRHRVHNLNLVSPDHFFPHVFRMVYLLRKRGFDLPVVYNLSGYQSVKMLIAAQDYVDIYLPDFKYADSSLAGQLSKCRDYPRIALAALSEMVKQKGFLDACRTDGALAGKGVLVRHLILPGGVENSINVLTSLLVEFGRGLPLSIMSQYSPVLNHKDNNLNRTVTVEEFGRVYSHALELGFEHLFVQFPERESGLSPTLSPFLPDFHQKEPFMQSS